MHNGNICLLNTGMNKDWKNILQIGLPDGKGVIPQFTQYKEFFVCITINGFMESHYMAMSTFQKFTSEVTFGSSFYYNASIYGYASILIKKNGEYNLGQGVGNKNVDGSSISVWAR